ncbi:MAG: OmpA-OmpF porin, family [Bacteroidota bacterium]|nr:OmpA-OmpF porin, family [Bacteroidota bacterium]
MNLINKCLFILLMTTSFLLHSQESKGPWSASFGLNAIDTRVSAGGNVNFLDNRVSQPFNVMQNWNVFPALYFNVDRRIKPNLSIGAEFSFNKISKFVTFDGNRYLTSNPGNLKYYGLDAVAKYSLMSLINSRVIDPKLVLGVGMSSIGSNKYANLNLGFKLSLWFTDVLAVTAGTTYKYSEFLGNTRVNSAGELSKPTYLQHTLGLTYNFGGTDTDNDGIRDKEDACPDAKGLKEFKGCPDSDNDGIIDTEDKCPLDKGSKLLEGCPDKDEDGIADVDDACPTQSGDKSLKGCPDSDKDGVADGQDKCPNKFGELENNGCPWPDTDKDGVLDKDDPCPKEAGTLASKGCPDVVEKVEVKEITQEAINKIGDYSKQILFNSGKSIYKDTIVTVLESMVVILKEFPTSKFIIEGHTDNVGSYKLNLKLSQKRADAIKNYLVKNGISEDRLSAVGMSESDPVASNKTLKGKSLNRRTEVKLVK